MEEIHNLLRNPPEIRLGMPDVILIVISAGIPPWNSRKNPLKIAPVTPLGTSSMIPLGFCLGILAEILVRLPSSTPAKISF